MGFDEEVVLRERQCNETEERFTKERFFQLKFKGKAMSSSSSSSTSTFFCIGNLILIFNCTFNSLSLSEISHHQPIANILNSLSVNNYFLNL